ncbi:hypothetical protein, partial [Providencia rettgeri]|uniref:hypothetical protein n=1 Tax=Providencia rettgeri TaxID=587 RepID=UPI00300FB9C5
RKSKKLLDSHGGKRNIRLLATTTSKSKIERLVATLFNNLSDNLCGHSQDTIKKIFDFKS